VERDRVGLAFRQERLERRVPVQLRSQITRAPIEPLAPHAAQKCSVDDQPASGRAVRLQSQQPLERLVDRLPIRERGPRYTEEGLSSARGR
jgi:hypothetical protein